MGQQNSCRSLIGVHIHTSMHLVHNSARSISIQDHESLYVNPVIHHTGGIVSCSPIDIPECLTPTLEDHNLSEMLVMVANQDKDYVGCNMMTHDGDESEGTIPKLVGQTLVIIIIP